MWQAQPVGRTPVGGVYPEPLQPAALPEAWESIRGFAGKCSPEMPCLSPSCPKTHFAGNSEGCAREAGLNVGASPTRRVGLFAAEHDLDSVAARRGWKLREMGS